MVVTGRDREVLRLLNRFRFCLGRHIKDFVIFSSSRVCDRRLAILTKAGYLNRRKLLYGIPYLYTLTHKGRMLISANKRESKIRLEQITHDIHVLDSLIYFLRKYNISLNDVESERELHISDGFGTRKHHPDFVFTHANTKYAVEVELTPKAKVNLERNVRDNYLNYDVQVWITNDNKVFSLLRSLQDEYSGIEIIRLGEILCPK